MKGTDIYEKVRRFRATHRNTCPAIITLNPKDFEDIEKEARQAPTITIYKNTVLFVRNRHIDQLTSMFSARVTVSDTVSEGEKRLD